MKVFLFLAFWGVLAGLAMCWFSALRSRARRLEARLRMRRDRIL